jgi:hypothetical protein
MTAHAEYLDAKVAEQEITESIATTQIESFESWIEYLDDISSKYSNLVDAMQSIATL